jgi:endonuclease/exonuclease/phosphatase family metal-dependent hydrolase
MALLLAILGLFVFLLILAGGVAAGWGVALGLKPYLAHGDLRLLAGTAVCWLVVFGLFWLLRAVRVLKPEERAPGGRWRLAARIMAWLAVALLGCYAVGRALSPFEAVQLHALEAAAAQAKPADPDAQAAAGRRTLRVAAYNIAHGRGTAASNFQGGTARERENRLVRIAQMLAALDLDVVVLNEVDFQSLWSGNVDQARAIAEAAGFPYWVEQRNVDAGLPRFRLRFGNAVLSRFPISRAERVDYPGRSRWETLLAGKKHGVVCTIDLPWGEQVRVLAVHLEHRDAATRRAAARVIADLKQSGGPPLVAAGDFNSTRPGFPDATADEDGRTALSLVLGEGFTAMPEQQPLKREMTFSSTEPRQVIDWVLVPEPWRSASHGVLTAVLSDHRLVVETIEMGE